MFVNVSDMPCWYFDKKEIRNTPSHRDAIDPSTEARYRREGARFIIDAGTKMGLYPFNLWTLMYIFVLEIFSPCNEHQSSDPRPVKLCSDQKKFSAFFKNYIKIKSIF